MYLFYLLFFAKETFYKRNRIYLLLVLLLPAIIPVLRVFNFSGNSEFTRSVTVLSNIILSGNQIDSTVSERVNSFDFIDSIVWIYFLFALIFLMRSLIRIASTLLIIRKGTLINSKFPRIVVSDSEHPAFSFFPFVVIPNGIYEDSGYGDILEHERTHVRQGHTFDLLLCELSIAFQWFNPFIWLIRRSILLNHEYLADNVSIKNSSNSKEYQYKLLNIPVRFSPIPLTHNFSSSIKKRLVMINKKPTRNFAALKNVLLLPVAAILFILFSFKNETGSLINSSQEPLFSKTSVTEIYKFLSINICYPQEAKNASDTGVVYILVKMNKGGVIKECKAFSDKNEIKAPLMDEIVVVAYKPSSVQSIAKNAGASNDHPALKAECLRIANKIGTVDIPEWKDKEMEFVLAFKFTLK